MAQRLGFRGGAVVLIGAASLFASGVPVVAASAPATPADFSAPIFGTTATLAEAKMPTYEQVRCSDASCTRGVVPGAEGGITQYSSTTIARGGVFADSPFFVAKLNKHWSNIGFNAATTDGQTDDYSTFTINLAEIGPGADIPALVAADVAKYSGATLGAPTTVDGATVWLATADYRKGLWSMVYVSKGDALARGVCIQYGKERGSVTCSKANAQKLTLNAVTKSAPTKLDNANSIRNLIPVTPARMKPLLLNIEPTKPLWANNIPTPALERSLSKGKNSVSFQYGVTQYPALLIEAKVAAVGSEAPARDWTKSICTNTTTTDLGCKQSRIQGPAFGYIGVSSDPAKSGKTVSVASHFTGAGKLGDAYCFAPGNDATLTPTEVKVCTEAITELATAVVGR